jgi:SM-20-related protein
MTDVEVEALGTAGWFVREGFAPAPGAAVVVAAQREELDAARLARDHAPHPSVRGDRSRFVELDDGPLAPLVAGFEALRLELNADAWLGLTRFDLQLAHYPAGGAGYHRHRDALRRPHDRRVTAISYLNPIWSAPDGGELLLHVDPPVTLAPLLGRLVVFLSERVEHEVLPTWFHRFAATAWYHG